MNFRRLAVGALAVLASLGAAAMVQAAVIRQEVRGRLSAEGTRTRAAFHIRSHRDTDKDRSREDIHVDAKKLDTTKDSEGNPPDYHLWLVTKDGTASDFGWMALNRGGSARFRFDSKRDDYPDGVSTVTAFGEGKIQVRVGDTVVLEGSVPAFLATGGEPVQGSRATVEGKTRLSATDSGGRAKGEIQAHYHADGRRVREQVRIRCQRTDGARSPYSVVAIASDATETELFTGLRPRNRGGEFHATLDTRGGYEIPGGGLVGLSEQTIEVRDKDGAVVLTGTFPDVTVD